METKYCYDLFAANFLCLSTEAWASWVQAFGTIVALAIAIGVAVWQRIQQRHDAYDGDLRRHLAQSQLLFFLTHDVLIWLELRRMDLGQVNMPIDVLDTAKELIERINAGERNEFEGHRVIAFNLCRSAISAIRKRMVIVVGTERGHLPEGARGVLNDCIVDVKQAHIEVAKNLYQHEFDRFSRQGGSFKLPDGRTLKSEAQLSEFVREYAVDVHQRFSTPAADPAAVA